jgi:hypothetical protein
MKKIMPLRASFTFHRAERRIPMEIPVVLDGHRDTPGAESTFTENVSARGARVVSVIIKRLGPTAGRIGGERQERKTNNWCKKEM